MIGSITKLDAGTIMKTKKWVCGKTNKTMMGVDTPIPPVAMKAAAPDGAPPRRIRTFRDNSLQRPGSNRLAPPCLGEALRRGALVKFRSTDRCSAPARFNGFSTEWIQQLNGVPL
jgi:hypothetical protein